MQQEVKIGEVEAKRPDIDLAAGFLVLRLRSNQYSSSMVVS